MPYIGKSPSFGVRNRFVYLADASDTSVSGADANGSTLTFTDGAFVDVYLNGVLLKPTTDYNTNTANTIAGISSMSANDEVTVIVYDVFAVGDTVSAVNGGTFNGAVVANSTLDMNGTELILDVDADTSITADTDDTIDIRVGGSDKIRIDSSGRLLMGATTAESFAPSTTPQVQIEGTDHHTSSVAIIRNSNDNGQALLILGKSRGTSIGADTVVQDDDNVGEVLFTAADGSDRTPQVASVRAAVDGTPGSNDMPGRLEFYTTADGSQTITKRMTINSSGLVTIQNDSDTDYNTNQTASNTVLNLKNTTSGASNSVGLSFSTEANGEQYITAVQVSDNSRSDLTFGARNGGSRTETMRIAGDSHVLINMQTALQSAYLSIEGQGRTSCISLDADSSTGGLVDFRFGDSAVGNINTNGSTTSYVTSSDYRLKENVSYDWDATTRLKQLKPARFNFKKDADKTLDGFLAHEVSSIVPEAISGTKDGTQDLGTIKNKDGNIEQENALEIHTKKDEGQTWTKTKTEDVYQGIDQGKLVPLLVKTIQELEARVTALESK